MTTPRPAIRTLDRSLPQPLWEQLRLDLIERLQAGEFTDRFPGEMELVGAYSVSRHTVREALRLLREAGWVQSARGRGSVVQAQQITQPLGAMYSLFQELEARGIEQRSLTLAADRRLDPEVAARLGLPPEEELVYLERIRLADDEPIAWDRVWLEPELGAPLLTVDMSHTGIYGEWARSQGIRLTGGKEVIRAVSPSAALAERLAMDHDEAAMLIERTGLLEERTVEYRITLVRGSRVNFTAEWSSGRPYRVDISG